MSQLAQNSKMSFNLQVLNGPDKGFVYQLLSQSVKIGRDPENDISLEKDKKCSRQHALIAMTPNGLEIKNISERNSLFVDGKEVTAAVLKPSSVIQIGDTKLQFNLNSGQIANQAPKNFSNAKRKNKKVQGGGPSPFFYIAIASLVLLVVYLKTAETPKKTIPTIPSDEEVSAQIDKSRKIADKLRQERRTSGRDTREYREAQAAYIKGFRDSQKGQYERARGHFQTCLAIFPQHPLCGQALTNANTKFDELVQYYFNLGNGYLSKNQFRQCKNAFENVLIMQKDRTSEIFKSAQAKFETCDLRERERL